MAKLTDSEKDYIVVIDAGHGGEDPGAVGYLGLREKDVVLKIARRLARLIDEEPGMSPLLTRTGDYYLETRRRVDIARRVEAALFVSIHADAFRSRSARGASVYSLSQSGATSEMAAYLAQRENAADLAGGVSLSDRDEDLAEVMLDMQLDWKIEESRLLGTQLLSALATLGSASQSSCRAGWICGFKGTRHSLGSCRDWVCDPSQRFEAVAKPRPSGASRGSSISWHPELLLQATWVSLAPNGEQDPCRETRGLAVRNCRALWV